jgi:glutamate 5-kinase
MRRVAEDLRIREAAMTAPATPEAIDAARRIVVKVGSSSISGHRAGQLGPLVDALAAAHARGVEVVLVSSGAIATGMPYLRLQERPTDLAVQQAAAAVGQSLLIKRYQERLDLAGITAGQVLLTASDIDNPTHRKNAERAMETLLALRILPIVNENDTVATHEIRFGDNDRLAALVARLLHADLLVLLSDVDALYTRPPEEPGAVRIPFVAAGDPLTEVLVTETNTGVGTGGAATKLAAARMAAEAGIAVLLTATDRVRPALAGERVGTWFEPAEASAR